MLTLYVVFEHITTAEAACLVLVAGDNVAASVTSQHLLLNRNDLLGRRRAPHHFCLPVLKREPTVRHWLLPLPSRSRINSSRHRFRAARQVRQRKRLRLRLYVQRDDRRRALREVFEKAGALDKF